MTGGRRYYKRPESWICRGKNDAGPRCKTGLCSVVPPRSQIADPIPIPAGGLEEAILIVENKGKGVSDERRMPSKRRPRNPERKQGKLPLYARVAAWRAEDTASAQRVAMTMG
jgi:hypothetical protein